MTDFLYRIIATVATVAVWLIERLFELTVFLTQWGFGLARYLTVQSAVALMRLIDQEKFDDAQAEMIAAAELEQQADELSLLSQATQLKEHALDLGEWTDEHTEALQAIGNALLNDCDWDEEHVHQYLKDVVEGGTDLKYNYDPDDDEED